MFLILVLTSFIIRIYFAFSTDLWLDEVLSLQNATLISSLDLIFSKGMYWDFHHPPLYFFMLKIWSFISLEDDWLRLLNLIFFIPSVYLIFLIGKKIKDKYVGMISALLFCFHPFFINLSFQLRPYSVAIFISLLAFLFFLRHYKKNNLNDHLKTSFLFALGIFIDYSIVWLLLPIFIYSIYLYLIKNNAYKNIIKIIFYSLIISSYQVFILFKTIFILQKKPGGVSSDIHFISNEFFRMIGFQGSEPIGFLLFFLILLSIIFFLIRNQKNNTYLLIGLMFLVGPVISMLLSLLVSPIFLSRNLFISNLAMIFLLSLFFRSYFKKSIFIKLFLIIIFFTFLNTIYQKKYFNYLTGLESFVKSEIRNDDFLIFLPMTWKEPVSYYVSTNSIKVNYFSIGDRAQINKNNQILQKKRLIFFYGTDCLYRESCSSLIKNLENDFCLEKDCVFKWI